MVAIYTLCAWIAWTPASGDPEGHYFYEDSLPPIVAFDNQMEVCRVDYDVPHTYFVTGFNGDLEGPESDRLTVVWPMPEPTGLMGLLWGWVFLGWMKRFR
jgi:hypothetical protein